MSYRRHGERGYAGRLTGDLRRHLGAQHVFQDIHQIDSGDKFRDVITRAVASCTVFIAVIGDDWLTVTDDAGQRRLDDPEDVLRIEIATALSRDIRVIPVLVGGARLPRADELPDSLKPLTERHAHELTDAHWDDDVQRLVATVRLFIRTLDPEDGSSPLIWPVIVAASVHVAAGLIAALVHVPSTDVRIDLQVSHVGFALSAEQPVLTDLMTVASLGASSMTAVDLPVTDDPGGKRYHESSVLLTALGNGETAGTIQLDPLRLPAAADLSLSHMVPGYRLSVQHAVETLGVSVQGPVRVVLPPQVLNARIDFSHPRRVTLYADSGEFDLDFQLPAGGASTLAPQLATTDLRLYGMERWEGAFVPVSTILGGRLYSLGFGRDGRALGKGEMLRFAWSEGEIGELRLDEGQVALTFSGQVGGMKLGSGKSPKNLMPTWLEWLLAHPARWVSVIVYLMLVAALTVWWWRTVQRRRQV